MKARLCLILGLCLLLSACGTLRIDVDYGWTPQTSGSQPAKITATPTVKPATPSPSPAQPSATATQPLTPTATVRLILKAVAISAGEKHTCVVTNAGIVNCWGNNEHGQLGDGTMVNSNVPVEVRGVGDAAAVAAGWAHTCVLTRAGAVKCWGYNKNGELGNGKTADSSTPVEVSGLAAGVVSIGTNEDHTCAVTVDGAVKCWGLNKFGQLGDGTRTSRSVPVEVQGLYGKAERVAAGWGHTCVLGIAGGIQCWGNNEYGQLGYGQESFERLTPVMVLDLQSGVIGISAAGGQTCALSTGGAVRCWGNNKYGQLGDGTGEIRRSPVAIQGLEQGVAKVVTGWNHTCAVMGNGEVKCWGWNYYGQLGDETRATQSLPADVRRLMEDAVDLAPGWAHTCAITASGGVKCWGRNESGQLGDGTNIDSIVPLGIAGLQSSDGGPAPSDMTPTATPLRLVVQPLAAGWNHVCAVTAKGGVNCWGNNEHGQLGDGTMVNSRIPVAVHDIADVVAVAVGGSHTCALTAAGSVKCWGDNGLGQLGDGTTIDRVWPVAVFGIQGGVVSISAGNGFTCAVMDSGAVRCWGYSLTEPLGSGTPQPHAIPADIQGLGGGNLSVSCGAGHACVLTAGGALKCWGWNDSGQLGDGTIANHASPTTVAGLPGAVRMVGAGAGFTCAVLADGGVVCWGANNTAQMGDGTQGGIRTTPVRVAGLAGTATRVSPDDNHACALLSSGAVQCWGWNEFGQLGDGNTHYDIVSEPVGWSLKPVAPVGLDSPIIAIATGLNFSCAMNAAHGVWCWGRNESGQLGDGTMVDRLVPTPVVGA